MIMRDNNSKPCQLMIYHGQSIYLNQDKFAGSFLGQVVKRIAQEIVNIGMPRQVMT